MRAHKIAIAFVLGLYLFLHLIQLEVFPFYLFAMYSDIENPKTEFVDYRIMKDGEEIEYKDWSYRRYIYLRNTLQAYDNIISNDNKNPQADIISKYLDRLYLTGFGDAMEEKHKYINAEQEMKSWLLDFLGYASNYRVYKDQYQWVEDQPALINSVVIVE